MAARARFAPWIAALLLASACTTLKHDAPLRPDAGHAGAQDAAAMGSDASRADGAASMCAEPSNAAVCGPERPIHDGGTQTSTPPHDAGADGSSRPNASPDAGPGAKQDAGSDAGTGPGPGTSALTLKKSGNGTGTVLSTSPDDSINCDGSCTTDAAEFENGSAVTLVAIADEGSHVGAWSVASCSGVTCNVTIDSPRTVTIAFTKTSHALSVSKSGDGSGTVSSSPAGIECGSDCDQSYEHGTMVTLTASATGGASFGGWSGACSGFATACIVDMDATQSVSAAFDLNKFSLSVSPTGSGAGSVTADLGSIDCPTTCSDTYTSGSVVTLTATADATSSFTGWGGDCSGSSCTVSLTQARSVTAAFTREIRRLTVDKSGTGKGTLVSSPGGVGGGIINCGAACSTDDQDYVVDTTVTLTAIPDADSIFSGWSGACTGKAGCTVTMSAARTVTAGFGPEPLGLGASCTSSDQCGSTHCVDNVCCENACNGVCSQCSASGTCSVVPADDPACPTINCGASSECITYANFSTKRCKALGTCKTMADCTSTPAPARTHCGDIGLCDGTSSCVSAQVPCPAQACTIDDDTLCCIYRSNGTGTCELRTSSACNLTNGYLVSCRGEQDCALGQRCCFVTSGPSAGSSGCAPAGNSCPGLQLCESGTECPNGQSCNGNPAGLPQGFLACN